MSGNLTSLSSYLRTQLPPPGPVGQSGTNVDNDGRSIDDVSIIIDGCTKILGWQSVQITRSAESYPNNFVFTMTEQFTANRDVLTVVPGKPCVVNIGKDTVITGYIDRYVSSVRAGAHDVEIVGRGKGQDLVDCSADLLSEDSPSKGGSISATNTLDLASKLADSFGIECRSAVTDLGVGINAAQIAIGETPYEVIERIARYAGYLIYEDTDGTLVLDRVGTNKMASGFGQGDNIEAASRSFSIDQRFSSYTAVWNTVSQLYEGPGIDPINKHGIAFDLTIPRFRPKIFVSAQNSDGIDLGQSTANWMLARARGRSQAINITCDSWRDINGDLWKPNWLAPVHMPALKLVQATWLIASVTFRKDASGTHADLVLMPPEAFSIEPTPLHIWDRELSQATPDTRNTTTSTPSVP